MCLASLVVVYLSEYSEEGHPQFLTQHLYQQVEEQSDLCDVTIQVGTWVSSFFYIFLHGGVALASGLICHTPGHTHTYQYDQACLGTGET